MKGRTMTKTFSAPCQFCKVLHKYPAKLLWALAADENNLSVKCPKTKKDYSLKLSPNSERNFFIVSLGDSK